MCAVRLQIRRDTLQNWSTNNPVIADGEIIWITGTEIFKIGDGTKRFNELPELKGEIPNDGKLIIQKNGVQVAEFSANYAGDDVIANIEADTPTFANLQGNVDDNQALSNALSGKLPTSHNTDENAHEDIRSVADEALTIAKGKSQARTFETFEDMETFLSDPENKGKLNVGDNLYIKELDTPDYWISAVLETVDPVSGYYYAISQLEAEKPDITNMATTDTAQTISGDKNFTGSLQKNGVDVATTTDVNNHHDSTKQDTISDLASIRTGAGLGATALQSISSTDVTNALGYTPYSNANPSGYQTNVLEGVQLNGSDLTIDVNKKVNIPVADNNTFGVMKPVPAYGLSALGNNVVGVSDAKAGGDALITAKANAYRPLTPRCIDLAVKTGLTTNTLTLTDTEQRNAQSWLGTTDMEIEFSDGSESTLSLVGKM